MLVTGQCSSFVDVLIKFWG